MVISSFLIGNKDIQQIKQSILEIDFMSKIIKLIAVTKVAEENIQHYGFDKSPKESSLSNEPENLNFVSTSYIKKVSSNTRIFAKESKSTLTGIVSQLHVSKGEDLIKTKFGSVVTNFSNLLFEKRLSLEQMNRKEEIKAIPLSKFDLTDDFEEEQTDFFNVEVVSKKPSNAAMGLRNTIANKFDRNFFFSDKSYQANKEEKIVRRNQRFGTSKPAVIEHSFEESYENDF